MILTTFAQLVTLWRERAERAACDVETNNGQIMIGEILLHLPVCREIPAKYISFRS